MRKLPIALTTAGAACAYACAVASAATSAFAQAPTVRLINAPDASTNPVFGAIAAVRELPNGRVLVNDFVKRQLSLVDQPFANVAIVADSASGSANSYGTRPGGLIPYLGDSTLFVDPAGLSMFVIDPAGTVARVASVPRAQDAQFIGTNLTGTPGIDAKGRLVYRGPIRPVFTADGRGGRPISLPDPPDSAMLVRVDLATRKLDTATYFKIQKTKLNVQQTERGFSATSEINPLPTVDDWAVLADGSIAIVRGQDYHVDVVDPSGAITSGTKIPFDWQRLSDEDKAAVLDSAKTAMDRARAAGAAGAAGASGASGAPGAGGAMGSGMVVMMRSDDGSGSAPRVTMGGPGNLPPVAFVSASELPDYRPAFTAGSVRADVDGNLWVRTSATRAGSAGAIYDVINRRGELVDRIQIPAGRQIVGFGKGGVVYMAARDDHSSWLERTHR